jgi:hypothetical protein
MLIVLHRHPALAPAHMKAQSANTLSPRMFPTPPSTRLGHSVINSLLLISLLMLGPLHRHLTLRTFLTLRLLLQRRRPSERLLPLYTTAMPMCAIPQRPK